MPILHADGRLTRKPPTYNAYQSGKAAFTLHNAKPEDNPYQHRRAVAFNRAWLKGFEYARAAAAKRKS